MSILGLVCLVAAVAAWALRPALLPVVLALAALLPDTAAIRLGRDAVSCYHLVALVAVARLAWLLTRPRVLQRMRDLLRPADRILLVGLAGYATVITAIGPAVFAGIRVYTPRGGLDIAASAAAPLGYSISNPAQLAYLLLNLAVVVYLVAEPRMDPRILGLCFAAAAALALAAAALGPLWPRALLDTMPFSYVEGQGRIRGTYVEPSVLGVALAGGITYFAARALRLTGAARWLAGGALLLCVAAAALNRSGTLLAGVGGVALVAVVLWIARAVARRRSVLVAVGIALAAVAVTAATPVGSGALDLVTAGKLHTESFVHRSAADLRALEVLRDTLGLGAGLGSDRASGLLTTELACIGLLGTAALFALLGRSVVVALRRDLLAAAPWALVAIGIAQVTSVPDASLPFLWLALGVTLATARPTRPLVARAGARRAPARRDPARPSSSKVPE